MEVLDVDDAEHEDELVEDEIPKFVFHVLDTREDARENNKKLLLMRATADVKRL